MRQKEVRRPILRWHGGKWLLAPWIISHFPPHRIYTEVYGGAASILLRKHRAYSEVYNDLDGAVVNLFRVLQWPDTAAILKERLMLTPFARKEFELAYNHHADPVEWARRLVVRSFMGFGSNAHNPEISTGFRSNSSRSGTTPAHDWANYPGNLAAIIERLRGVVIESRPATEILVQHDREDALHYVDPPYPHSTRADGCGDYHSEMSDDDHEALAEVLRGLKGMVVLSGYPCDLYDKELYPDWHRVERKALADGARKRVEVLWINKAAAAYSAELF